MSRKSEIKRYYSERAVFYDQQKARTWKSRSGFPNEIVDQILSLASVSSGKAMLEVGVGTGRVALPLLERNDIWLVGIDLSKEMLHLARGKLPNRGNRLDLIQADAEHLPFKKGSFDTILCISVMHYLASVKSSLIEFSEILRTNGLLVCGDLKCAESDGSDFLNQLEHVLSHVHVRYYKISDIVQMLEHGPYRVSSINAVPYRKSFDALLEDKGKYFGVAANDVAECLKTATEDVRNLYSIDNTGLTLFYALIAARKKSES